MLRWSHTTGAGFALTCAVVFLCEVMMSDKAGPVSGLGAGAIVLACAPLAIAPRRPLLAVGLVTAGIFAVLETVKIYETITAPLLVASFIAAKKTDRRTSLWLAAALAPAVLLAITIYSPHGILHQETPKNLAILAIPLIAGNAVRDRKAYLAGLVERAETAERTREEEALRRVGEERLRIARDVHDVVAHAMVAINVQAGVAAHLIDRRPEQAREALTQIKRASGDALTDLRATLDVLRSAEAAPTRPAQGLDELHELADGVRAAGVAVDLKVTGDARVASAIDTAAYRIVQEALTNVLRHADATLAEVRVARGPEGIEIEVVDDGRGSNGNGNGSGNGVSGMRERAAAIGGEVEAGARPDGGWRVHAWLPT